MTGQKRMYALAFHRKSKYWEFLLPGRPDLTAKLHLAELPLYVGFLWALIHQLGIVGAAAAWAIILTMVGLGIFNTILMRVVERRYEFGLFSALGLQPAQLAVMIIGESLALTTISLAVGLVLGLSVHHYFATSGLDLRWFFKSSLPAALVFDPIIYARLSLTRIASSVGIVLDLAKAKIREKGLFTQNSCLLVNLSSI